MISGDINKHKHKLCLRQKDLEISAVRFPENCGMQHASSHQVAESTLRLVGSEGLEEAEDLRQREHRMTL